MHCVSVILKIQFYTTGKMTQVYVGGMIKEKQKIRRGGNSGGLFYDTNVLCGDFTKEQGRRKN